MTSWLHADARNRALRTLLQTAVLVVLAPAADAALQVLVQAFAASPGAGFDWRQVAMTAAYSAGSGAALSLIAYLHRLKVDPSPIPSAPPPEQPLTVTAGVDLPRRSANPAGW